MFDWIKRLFGEGYIYATFECTDGSKGRSRVPYIGDINTLDRNEIIQNIKREVFFKSGKTVKTVTIID